MRQTIPRGGSVFRQWPDGFSLIELLVVLLILVMAAAAMPLALNHMLPSRRVEAAAERLRSTVRELEARSVLAGHPLQTEIGTLQHSVGTGIAVQMMDGTGANTNLLRVYPDGSTSGTRFQLQSTTHRVFVTVSEISGRVSVERNP